MSMKVGRTPAACNLVYIMLESEENWPAAIVLKNCARDRILESLKGIPPLVN